MSLVSRAADLLKAPKVDRDALAQVEEEQPGAALAALDSLQIDQTREKLTPDPSQEVLVDRQLEDRWSISGDAVKKPRNLSFLVDLVAWGVRNGQPLRAIGAGFSQSDVTDPADDNLAVNMAPLGLRLVVDAEVLRDPAQAATLYRCEAGRNVGLVIQDLDEDGLGLPNMGAGNFQGVVGAIQTCTHGSGGSLPPLADLVEAMEVVVVEDGVVKVLQLEREGDRALSDPERFAAAQRHKRVPVELRQDDALMNAFVVSLGCMGVVYSVTLRVQPQYWLHESRTLEWWGDLKEVLLDEAFGVDPDTGQPRFRNYEVLVDPFEQDRGGRPDHRVLVTRRRLVSEHVDSGSRPVAMAAAKTEAGRAATAVALMTSIKDPVTRVPKLLETSLPKTAVASFQRRSFEVLLLQLNLEATAEEYGVRAQDAVAATEAILARSRANLAEMRRRLGGVDKPFSSDPAALAAAWRAAPLHTSPFSLRFTRRSDALIAMPYEQDTCMIEVPMAGTGPHDRQLRHGDAADPGAGEELRLYAAYDAGRQKLWADLEADLAELGVRPHWGLWNTLTPAQAAARYPRWADFAALAKRFNSTGVFDSPFTLRMGLSDRQDASSRTVRGEVVVRVPSPLNPDRCVIHLKEAPAWALWSALAGAQEKGRKRRAGHVLVSTANIQMPVLAELVVDGGELVTIDDWELYHGFTTRHRGVASLDGDRLEITGAAADKLREILGKAGRRPAGTAGSLTLRASVLSEGRWTIVGVG